MQAQPGQQHASLLAVRTTLELEHAQAVASFPMRLSVVQASQLDHHPGQETECLPSRLACAGRPSFRTQVASANPGGAGAAAREQARVSGVLSLAAFAGQATVGTGTASDQSRGALKWERNEAGCRAGSPFVHQLEPMIEKRLR